jgi:hypothetical protein
MKQAIILLLILSSFIQTPIAFASDTTGPTVGEVTPLSATYGVAQIFSVSANDPSGVESCTLVISSIYETKMSFDADTNLWNASYTFTTERSANSIRAKCSDSLGNLTTGKARIVTVSNAPRETSEVDATQWNRGDIIAASPVLIKTACPGTEDATHPCRTVYFLDDEGKRHAFTNEKVFFTWYSDYSNLHIISSSTMASFTLGKNIVYHPGIKMVKFPTVRTVYAVERFGLLRPVMSEQIAIELYGANWNQQIDDVSESFYSDYQYGEPISNSSDFDVATQITSVESINDNL